MKSYNGSLISIDSILARLRRIDRNFHEGKLTAKEILAKGFEYKYKTSNRRNAKTQERIEQITIPENQNITEKGVNNTLSLKQVKLDEISELYITKDPNTNLDSSKTLLNRITESLSERYRQRIERLFNESPPKPSQESILHKKMKFLNNENCNDDSPKLNKLSTLIEKVEPMSLGNYKK